MGCVSNSNSGAINCFRPRSVETREQLVCVNETFTACFPAGTTAKLFHATLLPNGTHPGPSLSGKILLCNLSNTCDVRFLVSDITPGVGIHDVFHCLNSPSCKMIFVTGLTEIDVSIIPGSSCPEFSTNIPIEVSVTTELFYTIPVIIQ